MKTKKKGAVKKTASKKGGQGRRPAGEDLVSVISKVLGGSKRPMGISEIAAAVKKTGYASSSPSFVRIVNMRLSTDKRFKRASRGQYVLGGKK